MAINLVNTFSTSDVNLTNIMSTTDKLYNISLSLTNMDNTTVPAIAHISTVEVNGALYQTDAEAAISTTDPVTSTTVADGTVYIMLTPSVSGTTCTAAFTATVPTWSDTKQGWYGTGSFVNCKYLEYIIDKNSTAYYKFKEKFKNTDDPTISVYLSTEQSITATGTPEIIKFDASFYNPNNFYSTSTGLYTCPVSGLYSVNSNIYIFNANSGSFMLLYKNGASIFRKQTPSTLVNLTITIIIQLTAGDTLGVYATGDGTSNADEYSNLAIQRL